MNHDSELGENRFCCSVLEVTEIRQPEISITEVIEEMLYIHSWNRILLTLRTWFASGVSFSFSSELLRVASLHETEPDLHADTASCSWTTRVRAPGRQRRVNGENRAQGSHTGSERPQTHTGGRCITAV